MLLRKEKFRLHQLVFLQQVDNKGVQPRHPVVDKKGFESFLRDNFGAGAARDAAPPGLRPQWPTIRRSAALPERKKAAGKRKSRLAKAVLCASIITPDLLLFFSNRNEGQVNGRCRGAGFSSSGAGERSVNAFSIAYSCSPAGTSSRRSSCGPFLRRSGRCRSAGEKMAGVGGDFFSLQKYFGDLPALDNKLFPTGQFHLAERVAIRNGWIAARPRRRRPPVGSR